VIEHAGHSKLYHARYWKITSDISPHRALIYPNHLGYLALRQARIIYQFLQFGAHHEQ